MKFSSLRSKIIFHPFWHQWNQLQIYHLFFVLYLIQVRMYFMFFVWNEYTNVTWSDIKTKKVALWSTHLEAKQLSSLGSRCLHYKKSHTSSTFLFKSSLVKMLTPECVYCDLFFFIFSHHIFIMHHEEGTRLIFSSDLALERNCSAKCAKPNWTNIYW